MSVGRYRREHAKVAYDKPGNADRADAMKYDIEADWSLLDTCNYRCGYCPIPHEKLGSKLRTFATVDAWRAAFDAGGKT